MTLLRIPVILGPTGVGKTALSLQLAQEFPIDIISVDSVLVYRDMDIGTAKPSLAERSQAPHYLIDICDFWEPYNAARFVQDTRALIQHSLQAKRVPLLVGGTVLYFKALRDGLATIPAVDPAIRETLQAQLESEGIEALRAQLAQHDPRSTVTDPQRVLRALEVALGTGKALSQWHAEQAIPATQAWSYDTLGLQARERAHLHEAISRRFSQMLDWGLRDEVMALWQHPKFDPELPSMRAVGYRQVLDTLRGIAPEKEMIARSEAATRQLAKRQLTWLRHLGDVHADPEQTRRCCAALTAQLQES